MLDMWQNLLLYACMIKLTKQLIRAKIAFKKMTETLVFNYIVMM